MCDCVQSSHSSALQPVLDPRLHHKIKRCRAINKCAQKDFLLSDCAKDHARQLKNLECPQDAVPLPCSCGVSVPFQELLNRSRCPSCGVVYFYSFCAGRPLAVGDYWHCSKCGICRFSSQWHCPECDCCTDSSESPANVSPSSSSASSAAPSRCASPFPLVDSLSSPCMTCLLRYGVHVYQPSNIDPAMALLFE